MPQLVPVVTGPEAGAQVTVHPGYTPVHSRGDLGSVHVTVKHTHPNTQWARVTVLFPVSALEDVELLDLHPQQMDVASWA